jgi:hypothetical protein
VHADFLLLLLLNQAAASAAAVHHANTIMLVQLDETHQLLNSLHGSSSSSSSLADMKMRLQLDHVARIPDSGLSTELTTDH